jgi:hypothetical protein
MITDVEIERLGELGFHLLGYHRETNTLRAYFAHPQLGVLQYRMFVWRTRWTYGENLNTVIETTMNQIALMKDFFPGAVVVPSICKDYFYDT